MAIKIRIIFTTAVITLLLLTEPITCALSTSDGEILSTTSQDGASITSTVFQENSQHTTESTNEQNTRSFVSHVTASTSTSSNQKNESFATVIDERYENSNSTSRSTTTKNPVVDSHQLPSSSSSTPEPSMSAGIRVLYRMTSTFLDVIQPPGKNLYDELGMESALAANPSFTAITESFSSKAQSDPKYFVRYWVGFAVCVAFGAVFVVVMPLVALFVSICRCCCHRCGHEKTGTAEKSRDRPIRICLGIFLFIFTMVILAGTVCAFMSNELVRQQTASPNGADKDGGSGGGLLSTIVRNLGEVDAFKQATIKEVDDLIVQINSTLNEEIERLKGFAEIVANDSRLSNVIGSDLIGNISLLNNTLVQLVKALRVVDADAEKLRILYLELNESLSEADRNMTMLCHLGGKTTHCNPPNLTTGLPDLNQLPNISSQLTTLDSILSQVINISVFEDISRRIHKELQPVLDEVSHFDISGTLRDISSSVKSAANSVDLKPLVDGVNQTRADVDRYGSYRFNVCVAISALLLLIVLLTLIGLCIGVSSKPPYDVDSTAGVTRWTAAHFLMASVVIMFLFCSVLMIIVAVLFVSGGIIYTDGCRGFDQRQDNTLVKIADSLLRAELGNVSFYGILRDCKNNDGIVNALNLDEKFHISDRFNLSILSDLANRINGSSIDLSQFQLNGPKDLLKSLRNSSLMNINLTAFNEMLNDTRLRSSLTEATNSLNATANDVNETTAKNGLLAIVDQLQVLSETIVVEITNRTEHLRIALKELNDTLYVENSTKTLTDFLTDFDALLERTENRTKYEAPAIIRQLVNDILSNTTSSVEKAIDIARTQVLTGIGRCSPISNVIESTVAAVCHSTLDPYNAFWFSYGWCVFLFIPTIALSVVLAQFYWRLDVLPQSYIETSGYDAYKSTYPEEYLRLHNLTTSQQVPRGQPDYIEGPAVNPGYVDHGDYDHTQGSRSNNLINNNGMDFYRGVGPHGNGSFDNPTFIDSDSNGYRIPRPTTAHAHSNSEDNRWQF